MSKRPIRRLTRDDAEEVALKALRFLAEDEARLSRFLTLTGLSPAELRANAGEAQVLAGVLNHLLEDESLLFVFTSNAGIAPEQVGDAHRLLTGNSERDGTGRG